MFWRILIPGLMLAAMTAGCSEGKTAAVSGTVTLSDGSPVPGATVCFSDPVNQTSASGVCGDDGSYTLTTFELGDGAPPGTYRVTVHHPAPQDSSQPQMKPVFDPRYGNPDTSGLQYTVEERQNQIDIVLDKR